ncbi:hypothetical protein EI94DRAFT_1822919 [Lactarius quietus]|nr:hypothetical protein EI94DRAFT_1822919 [Lactarius quietus]
MKKQKTQTATGLQPDWRKLIDHSGSQTSKQTMYNASLIDLTLFPTQIPRASMDPDDNSECVTSEVSLTTRPSSRTSTCMQSTSKGLAEVQDIWLAGTFDNNKVPSTLLAARSLKHTDIYPVQANSRYQTKSPAVGSHTTAMVGPVIKRKDINSAAYLRQSPFIKSEGGKLSKRYRNLKVADIPITEDHELAQWDLIVHGILDWAGTLPDTFGTNKHPDLLSTIQDLWDQCLPERAKDMHENSAIKKVIIDCLNE